MRTWSITAADLHHLLRDARLEPQPGSPLGGLEAPAGSSRLSAVEDRTALVEALSCLARPEVALGLLACTLAEEPRFAWFYGSADGKSYAFHEPAEDGAHQISWPVDSYVLLRSLHAALAMEKIAEKEDVSLILDRSGFETVAVIADWLHEINLLGLLHRRFPSEETFMESELLESCERSRNSEDLRWMVPRAPGLATRAGVLGRDGRKRDPVTARRQPARDHRRAIQADAGVRPCVLAARGRQRGERAVDADGELARACGRVPCGRAESLARRVRRHHRAGFHRHARRRRPGRVVPALQGGRGASRGNAGGGAQGTRARTNERACAVARGRAVARNGEAARTGERGGNAARGGCRAARLLPLVRRRAPTGSGVLPGMRPSGRGAIVSATIDMSAILAIVRYVSFAVSIILILRMLRTYRRVRAISRRSCVIAIAFPGAALLVYSVLIGSGLPSTTLSALFAFGLALGLWQGRKTGVWVEGGLPRAQNTIWFLFVWTISYVLMQALVQFGNRSSVKIGFASMMATTAIAVGCQGLILIRLSQGGLPARGAAVGRPRWTARTSGFPAAARAAPEVAGAARGGSSPIRPSGAKVALRARGTAAWQGLEGGVVPRDLGQAGAAALGPHGVRRFCSACGAALVGGDRFCRKCGSVIR